ncbi:MAG: head decoration protein [Deltaproteobacteria bacterium]|jgi:hypothetical protein|nr:head decoration protein [Deltaproteobacteria bacterium]
MATDMKKAPVLSELLKSEQPDYLGREVAKITSSAALSPGTVLQGAPAAAVPWDLSDAEDIYGILPSPVPAGSVALESVVLFAGPAAVNPLMLIWDDSAVGSEISAGLAELKKKHFIFTREPVSSELYPGQINRVPD